MGTGILGVAMDLDGRRGLSDALLWIGVVVWGVLAALVVARFAFHPARFWAEAATPGALTGVAGTCVLATLAVLHGARWAGVAGLALGGALGLGLLGPVLRHWRRPAVGASFLVAVAIQAVAALSGTVAASEDRRGLVVPALVLFAAGLAAYAWVLRDFDLRQLLTGRGDHWVAGGALAIGALAAGHLVQAIDATGELAGWRSALGGVAIGVMVAALAWLPVLVAAEVVRPRLRFSALRWATVFPAGMYAASAFTVGEAQGAGWLTDFARAWVWVAAAVWAVVSAGALVRGAALLRGRGSSDHADRPDPRPARPRSRHRPGL